jgi:hypothetical protein
MNTWVADTSFWAHHGWLFLLGCAFFPRITLLFFSHITFTPLTIFGWVFAPHITVAIIATNLYWHTNPVLCVIAWFFALAGTRHEAKASRPIYRWRVPARREA